MNPRIEMKIEWQEHAEWGRLPYAVLYVNGRSCMQTRLPQPFTAADLSFERQDMEARARLRMGLFPEEFRR